jgi:hypothetical protein
VKRAFARKSSLLGRQQRADARRNAHERSLSLDKTLNPAGYRFPAPGPMTEGGKKLRYGSMEEAKKATTSTGLGGLAAMDYLRKYGSKTVGKQTGNKKQRKVQK